jgi:hypothetical protein
MGATTTEIENRGKIPQEDCLTTKWQQRPTSIPGVSVEVILNGAPVIWPSNGYITRVNSTGTASLKVSHGGTFIGFDRVEGTGEVTMLKNHGTPERPIYQRTVPILQVNGKNLFYPDPKSAIWLLGVDNSGAARTYIVSLVAQNNYLFLTFCETFAEQCYKGPDGAVVCPGMVIDWVSMAKAVSEILTQMDVKLQPVSEYKPRPTPEPMPEGQARVGHYTIRGGYGVATATVRGEQVEARVHWSQMRTDRGDGLKYFLPYETIRFRKVVPRTGHKPYPKWELVECTLT